MPRLLRLRGFLGLLILLMLLQVSLVNFMETNETPVKSAREEEIRPVAFKVRTSPDTVKLKIVYGRIIGKKRYYVPGDNVTIQCFAGFALRGTPAIRYIGGKKWVPEVPTCNLSFFLILLILGM
ncbi:zona pellucida sperm-binding protein 3 receptor-like [Heteronotia binoei]|uniref:zona pellucida sperm-binding protein 3 receptor-like n=1 Tax=Heteronotia binoei TaxID=13085 RepID=UPI002931A98E|nr:zona pellucida sperm-binding protein 3 receptor-like [Heteronotia binoei]